ncbi:Uncharacterised protein [Mycobacteroides abscessus subsp. abscessus]|nr:Uncharacterised protein [Mycobacteroides abscessus subsp. abscessus]
MVKRDAQALKDMSPRLGFPQLEFRPAADDYLLVIQIIFQALLQVQNLRLAVDKCEHIDAEARLQGRQLPVPVGLIP